MAFTTYDFNNVKNDIRYLIRDPNFSMYDESFVNTKIDQRHTEIIQGDQWRFAQAQDDTISLAAGVNTFTLPTDFDSSDPTKFFLYHTDISEDNKIDYMPNGGAPSSTTTGTPYYWYIYANQAYVYPKANRAYTLILRYYKKPTVVDADNPTLLIPASHARVLSYAVALDILPSSDSNYQRCYVEYNNRLNDMVFKFGALSEDNRQSHIQKSTHSNW